MVDDRDDRDLRELFARLREEDARRAPSFRSLLPREEAGGRAPAEPRREPGAAGLRRALAWGTGLAAAAALALWLLPPRPGPDEPGSDPAVVALEESLDPWMHATDFLLETPGRELLEDVPEVGWDEEWNELWDPARGPDGSGGPEARRERS